MLRKKREECISMASLLNNLDKCFFIIVIACLLIVVSFVFILSSYVIIIQGKDGVIFGGVTSFFSGVIGALVALLSLHYKNSKKKRKKVNLL